MPAVTLHQPLDPHRAGDTINVDDDMAAYLIGYGYATPAPTNNHQPEPPADDTPTDNDNRPPARNASRDAWVEHAARVAEDLDTTDLTRDDIVEALEGVGGTP